MSSLGGGTLPVLKRSSYIYENKLFWGDIPGFTLYLEPTLFITSDAGGYSILSIVRLPLIYCLIKYKFVKFL